MDPLVEGTRLVFVRHGEAVCNNECIVGGPLGCGGLTELGREQASALRDRLVFSGELAKATALYTSILPRAIETAQIIAPGLPTLTPVADCDLCELHPGDADGLTWPEVVERFGVVNWDENPDAPISPGGESWLAFYERVARTIDKLVQRHPDELVVIVAHGGVVEQAMKIVGGDAPERRLRLRTEHCSMTEIEFRKGRKRLLRYNDRAPLAKI